MTYLFAKILSQIQVLLYNDVINSIQILSIKGPQMMICMWKKTSESKNDIKEH